MVVALIVYSCFFVNAVIQPHEFCPFKTGYLRVRCGTEALTPRYYKVGVCEYISGGKRAPRRPDPDDDYSGVRNPAPVVAAADEKGNVGCGKCPKKEK